MNSNHIKRWLTSIALATLPALYSTAAHAADGCKFLLCIAGPWTKIAACRPTVHEVFRDLARGRGFPTCHMVSAGNSAQNNWVDEAGCPSMYQRRDGESGYFTGCNYSGRITVYVRGELWSQVFWDRSGSTSTWYSEGAKHSLTGQPGSLPLDDQFVNDLNNWNATQIAPCEAGGGTALVDAFGAFQRCNYPSYESG